MNDCESRRRVGKIARTIAWARRARDFAHVARRSIAPLPTLRSLLFAFALTLAASALAWAETYPSRPITIIVPFAPGGPTDTIARVMAERMKLPLGQPVIIENVGGARHQLQKQSPRDAHEACSLKPSMGEAILP